MASKQRYYHDITDIESAKTAIHQLTDHVYQLRDRMDVHKEQLNSHRQLIAQADQKATVADRKASAFTLDLGGVKINAPTDPTSLQNGWTVRYNSSTNQFDFGV